MNNENCVENIKKYAKKSKNFFSKKVKKFFLKNQKKIKNLTKKTKFLRNL